ncbi:hypothetical protein ACGTRS_24610 [Burkholderia semiarida]|uniref:Flagellar FliJ protein n=1 Tax=Burkholderia semiarida TaxID=2843303 RepID=A0ABW7L8L8_9BURK
MNADRIVRSIERLAMLRQQEVDRLGTVLAAQEAECARYRTNLRAMEKMVDEVPDIDNGSPTIALNRADYKAAWLSVIRGYATKLAEREREMAETRSAATAAMCRLRSVSMVLARRRDELERAAQARMRKRQDDLATLAWLRRQAESGRFI